MSIQAFYITLSIIGLIGIAWTYKMEWDMEKEKKKRDELATSQKTSH